MLDPFVFVENEVARRFRPWLPVKMMPHPKSVLLQILVGLPAVAVLLQVVEKNNKA